MRYLGQGHENRLSLKIPATAGIFLNIVLSPEI